MADYNLGSAQGTIVLDYDGKGVSQAQSGLKTAATAAGKFAAVAVGGLALVTGAIAGIALKGGIERALNIQDAQQKLKGLGHSAQEITQIMEDALSSVKGTAFGLDEAATVAASAVAAGVQPGKALAGYLAEVADTATIAGLSLAQAGGIINTVTSGTRAYNGQLQQLSQQGVPIYQYLAKQLHTTTDDIQLLASKGLISSKMFNKALQDNIGGAALSSGATARGAFKNVQASLSRLGVTFVSGAVTKAPALFSAIEGAVDRLSTALAPYTGQINAKVEGFFQNLTDFINDIDFDKMISGITNFFHAIQTGNLSGVGGLFRDVFNIIEPLGPVFVAIGHALGEMSGSIGSLLAAGLGLLPPLINTLTQALQFLSDHPDLVAAGLIAIAVALGIFRVAQTAANLAELPAQAIKLAQIPVNLALANANFALANAIRAANGEELLGFKQRLPATAQVITETVAKYANAAATAVQNGSMKIYNGLLKGSIIQLAATKVAYGLAAVASIAYAAVTDGLTAAQWALDAAMAANPIGLVVAIIIVLIAVIAALVVGIIWLVNNWSGVMQFFHDTWEAIAQFFYDAFNNIMNAVKSWPITSFIQDVIKNLIKSFQDGWNFITGVIQGAIDVITGIFNYIGGIITNVINGILVVAKPFVDFFVTYVVPLFQAIGGLIAAVFNFIWQTIVFVFNQVVSFLTTVIGAIVSYFTSQWNLLVTIVTTVFTTIFNFISTIFTNIWNFVSGVVRNVVSFIQTVWGAIMGFLRPIFQPIFDFIHSIFTNIYNFISGIVRNVNNFIVNTWQGIVGFVTGIFNNVYNAIHTPIQKALDFIGGIQKKIQDFFAGAGQWLADAGKNIIDGLVNGIKGGLGWLTDTLNNITKMIPKTKGPEEVDRKLLTPNGQMIMEGLVAGINSRVNAVKDSLGQFNNIIPSEINNTVLANIGSRAAVASGSSSTTDARVFNYYAAPGGAQLSGQDELFLAMRRSKVVAPGWG